MYTDREIKNFIQSLSKEQREELTSNLAEEKELTINGLVKQAHENAVNKGFWDTYNRVIDELWSKDYVEDIRTAYINQFLILTIGEISESVEGLRKGDADNFKEELADVYIRLSDLVGGLEIDIETEIKKKMDKNKTREKMHGKLF